MRLKFIKLPIPFGYVLLGGIVLSGVLALRSFFPFLYWNEVENFAFERYALPNIINYTLWPFLVPLVYLLQQRFPVNVSPKWANRASMVIGCILVGFLHEVVSNVIYMIPLQISGKFKWDDNTMNHLISSLPTAMISRIIEFWLIYGILAGWDYYKKFKQKQLETLQLESELTSAQLQALRMQLQPHFLFNTLNTVSSLMEHDIKSAQRVVARLGNLLRTMLDNDQHQFVPLEQEIEYIKSYLFIEQMRFNDRLTIEYYIDSSVERSSVPHLILQPLVENAIKHGFAKQINSGTIMIGAQRSVADRLLLTVEDDGQGVSHEVLHKQNGIGLKNVGDRLSKIYRDDFKLDIETDKNQGFKVVLDIPLDSYDTNKDVGSR